MDPVDVVVVGGGQAGLATSYHLAERGIDHVVLERGQVGNSWRTQRWDSFRINTINKVNRLPGSPYAGTDPDGFGTAEGWADLLVSYASTNDLPVRTGVAVSRVEPVGDEFAITTSEGAMSARCIVAATGSFITPKIPEVARFLPADVVQLDAGAYRSPDRLPDGAILVVGSGDSGCQVAEDLIDAGRSVYLCLSNRRRVPRRYRGLDFCDWAVLSGRWDTTIDTVQDSRVVWNPDAPLASGVHGGHTLSYQALEAKGVVLLGKLLGERDGELVFDDRVNEYVAFGDDTSIGFKEAMDGLIERLDMDVPPAEVDPLDLPDTRADERQIVTELDMIEAGITTVIWTVGFTHDFGWLGVPVFDDEGHPIHRRGVTDVAGVYFVGLHWLHTLSSGLIAGVGRDAEHIAAVVADRLG